MSDNLRDNIIAWESATHSKELADNFKIDKDIPPHIRKMVISLIMKYWDAFDEGGVSRPVLGYEFCIDTGVSPPVCCRFPRYGIHEEKIMNEQIQTLEKKWIIDCNGPWGSIILLAPKTHQEDINNIDNFV